MKRYLLAVLALSTIASVPLPGDHVSFTGSAAITPAQAQSAPNWSYGYVPTAGEMRNAFASKQDRLTVTPLALSGGAMLGRLTFKPSTINGAGLTIPPGEVPTAPVNGDVWMTTDGFYARVNNATVSLGTRALGTMAAQNASAVAITGGNIGGVALGTVTAPTQPASDASTKVANTAYADRAAAAAQSAATAAATAATMPSGAVSYFATASCPATWLEANRAAVSRSTYSGLFAAIGTTYGTGDGSTTFNLPELRGEFIRGLDDGRGIDVSRTLGSAQADSVGPHTHNALLLNTNAGAGASGAYALNGGGTSSPGVIAPNAGSETRPRNVALLPCIKS